MYVPVYSGRVKLPEETMDICCGMSDSTAPFYTTCIEQRLFFSGQKAAGLGWKDPGSLGVGTREVF